MTAPDDGLLVATVRLATDRDVALARKAVGQAMDALASRAVRKTRFVTAVSEIARNAVKHGGGGELSVWKLEARRRIRVVCRDDGPGIPEIGQAMADGYTTGGGLGRGLGGSKRLVESFEIESAPGAGTVVRMTGLL